MMHMHPAERVTRAVVVGAVVVAAGLRLPTLDALPASDEGGFLLVASQWHSGGGSLYGHYWVDRPPLLIGLYLAADLAGGLVALRTLGILAAVAAVLLASRAGRLVAGHAGERWSAVAGAAFVSMPLFDAREVDGELLAVPFVLTAVVLVLGAARRRRTAGVVARLFAAGAAAAGAALVKQSFVDGFVFGLTFLAADAVRRRDARGLVLRAGSLLAGGVAVVTAVVLAAALRGTHPGSLWEALVVFRGQAAALLAAADSSATTTRLHRLPVAFAASGGLLLLALAARRLRRALLTSPLGVATLAMLTWETVAIVAGGSYWLHYLLGLVPTLVLATALAVRERDRWSWAARGTILWAAAVAVVGMVAIGAAGPVTSSQRAGLWLRDHARPRDTAVVAFGAPNVVSIAGLQSPYDQLWSLPVRVLDPRLADLTATLAGPRAPTWVLTRDQLGGWQLDPGAARSVLDRRYRLVADVAGYAVYRLRHDAGVRTTAARPTAVTGQS